MLPALALMFLCQIGPEPPRAVVAPIKVEVNQTAYHAVKMIEEDAQSLVNPHLSRYVWTPTGDVLDHASVDWVVNMVLSKATTQVPTYPIKGGKAVRIDFSSLAKNEKELEELLNNWELFAQDEPYFLATSSEVEEIVPCEPFKYTDGKIYTSKRVKVIKRGFGPHVPASDLILNLKTNVPIVEFRWAMKRMLSTVEGGLYYRFRGIPGTQAEFLKQFSGVSEKDVADLRSDQKYATFFSNVTAKPRAVLVFRGIGGRVGVNQNLVMITQDLSDNDVDPKKHPLLNLLDNKFSATEVITEMPNGFHAFAIFSGEGKRQDAAPDDVVKDHEVPRPYTAKLQGAISCIRCHAVDDGIKQVENDVAKIIGGKFRYFGEAKDGLPNRDTLDRAFGLYSASLDKPFSRARDDYSDAFVFLGSRYNLPERLTVAALSNHVANKYEEYWYKRVYAKDALKDLGFDVDAKLLDAMSILNKLIPDLPADEIGIRPEDPRVIALKRGLGINRLEFEQIYPDLASRLIQEKNP